MAHHERRILIADDDKDFRFLMRHVIRKNQPSATVIEATDGEAAGKLFLENGADLAIVDHKIPYLSGLDLVALIRKTNANIPIIFVSNSPAAEDESTGYGITHFLNKANLMLELPGLLHATLPKIA